MLSPRLIREVVRLAIGKRFRTRVGGDSMNPSFADGELVLCEPVGDRSFLAPGDVVVARHSFKNLDVIKFVADIDGSGLDALIELRSPAGDDSRQFGRVPQRTVKGRVTVNLTRRTFPDDWRS